MLLGAIEAGGTKMVCAVGNEHGEILKQAELPTRAPKETVQEMIDFFRGEGIAAIGLGWFGPVDLDEASKTYGYITSTPKLEWQNYPVVDTFRQALGIPVGFDTDVNAAALGEATWGCTQGLDCSMYMTVGTGVGVGLIVNGRPHHGMTHPEAGHMILAKHPGDPLGRGACPFHPACLEGLAAGPSLHKRWGIPGQELSASSDVWELEAYYIGQALCNCILMLSPQKIVLGGGVMHQESLFPLIRDQVRQQMAGYVRGKGMECLDEYIVPSALGGKQGVLGCICLAMNAYRREKGI